MATIINPQQGEIWWVCLDPTMGVEKKKTRPVVVISNKIIGHSQLKIVVPVTDFKPNHKNFIWMLEIKPTPTNGLIKHSTVDCLHVRSLDITRFSQPKIGTVDVSLLDEIILTVGTLIRR